MLKSYHGTFDLRGLRTLRNDDLGTSPRLIRRDGTAVPFLAILDPCHLSDIERALVRGDCVSAMELLADRAVSLGRVFD
jgi:hypothetical protein